MDCKKNNYQLPECPLCGDFFEFDEELVEHTNDATSHMTRINENLYLGACWNASNIEELRRAKIKMVISMAEEFSKPITNDKDIFVFAHFPLADSCYEFAIPKLLLAIRTLSLTIQQRKNVLVHCALGKSRSVAVIIAYLMFAYQLSFEEAFWSVQNKRNVASPNKGYMNQLRILDAFKHWLGIQQWSVVAEYLTIMN